MSEMTEEEKSVTHQIEVVSVTTVVPNGTGQMILKMTNRSVDLVGLELDSETKPIRLLASKLDLKLEDESGTKTPAEMIALATQDNGGPVRLKGFITLVVRNVGKEPRSVRGVLVVANEREEIPAKKVVETANAQSQVKPAASRTVKAPGGQSSSKRATATVHSANTPKVQRRSTANRTSAVKRVSGPARSVPVSSVRHAILRDGLEMVLPKPGQHAVLMLRGHVFGLVRFLTSRVPLHPSYVPTVQRQLFEGHQREGAVSVGGNEVAVLLRIDQIHKLNAVVGQRFNHLSQEDSDDIVRSLNASFDTSEEQPQDDQEKLLAASAAE